MGRTSKSDSSQNVRGFEPSPQFLLTHISSYDIFIKFIHLFTMLRTSALMTATTQYTSSFNLPKRNCSLESNLLNPKQQENTCYLGKPISSHNYFFVVIVACFLRQGLMHPRLALVSPYLENELDIFIFLWSPPKCWDYTRAPPFQASHS